MRWSTRALVAAAMLSVGCLPAELDEVGLRCSVERPCAAPLFCVEGRCALEAPPPDAGTDAGFDAGVDAGFDAGSIPYDTNLLLNPGFEELQADGGPVGWRANPGGLTPGAVARSGQLSARVRGNNSLIQSGLIPVVEPVHIEAVGQLFCARAFVRADSQRPLRMVLFIREKFADAGIKSATASSPVFPDGGAQWLELGQSFSSTVPGGLLDIKVQTTEMIDAGEALLVDDARLYLSSNGQCSLP